MSKKTTQIQDSPGVMDKVLWLLSLGVLASAIYGFYVLEAQPLIVRVLEMLAGAVLALWIASRTNKGRNAVEFLSATRKEIRLVVWPERKETVQTTLIVFVVVVIVGLFLWLMDSFFLWAVQWITGQGG